MKIELLKFKLNKNDNTCSKRFYEKILSENDVMNELELQRVYNYSSYPRVSKRFSDKIFVNFDDGERSGSHWTGVLKISHSTLVRLLDNPVIFYLDNDPNQSYIIIIKYKRLILNYAEHFVYTFF